MSSHSVSPSVSRFKFKVLRNFKALDDGDRKKIIAIVAARDLPSNLPLDANARVPNVIKNKTCKELRETLLKKPELFQILNSGIVCTASSIQVTQEGHDQFIEIGFDQESEQGIVNGGHTYATLLHVLHDNTTYSEGKNLKTVLEKDSKETPAGTENHIELLTNHETLIERIARARDKTQVQVEIVAPVQEGELLAQIGRARNLSQGVEATALQNLAGKFDLMKEVLGLASAPFGPSFVERVVWKTNQDVPEDSKAIPVKVLIQVLALMNSHIYPPATRVPTDVYSRVGIVLREFGEAEGRDDEFYKALTKILPELIRLYDHIYASLSSVDPDYPWADGKLDSEKKKRRSTATTPFLEKPCGSKVFSAFVWPIFSAFRLLLSEKEPGTVAFNADPIGLFNDMKTEIVATVKSFHKYQAHGIVHQVGKDKELWVRLQAQLETELKVRERLAALK
jgi:hypothetical protein